MSRRSPRRVELPLARQPGIDRPGLHDGQQLRCDVDHLSSWSPTKHGRVEKFSEHDGSVYSLQCLVGHAVAAQHVDDVHWLRTLKDDISDMFNHGDLASDSDAEYFEWRHSLNARQTRWKVEGSLATAAECHNNLFRLLAVKRWVIRLSSVLYVVKLGASRHRCLMIAPLSRSVYTSNP